MGLGSAHVSTHQSTLTGNNHGVIFGNGNLFDFYFEDVLMDGNVTSAAFLEVNSATENITFMRCHMGWPTKYGILQDPATTTGDGYSGITMIDTPIEQVATQPMSIINGGNIRIQGGYWTWSAAGSTATEGFYIKNVNTGPIWISTKLEPTYANANAQWVLRVAGYTNYNVHFDGSLNGFAPQWANFNTAALPPRRVVINDQLYAAQSGYAMKQYLTTTNQNLASASVYGAGNFACYAYLRVEQTCTVRLWVSYHNGINPSVPTDGDVSLDFQISATLTPGEYYFQPKYFYAYPTRGITIKADINVANAAWVSASIVPLPQ